MRRASYQPGTVLHYIAPGGKLRIQGAPPLRPLQKMPYRRKPRYEPLEDRRLLALVTVDTLSDTVDLADGVTSLREAIFATNLVGGPDTIEFAPSLTASGPATILLTQGELRISDDLTISGPGADLLTINASGNDPTPDEKDGRGSRVFHIDDGNGAAAIDVTLTGLVLTGGDARASGGAILSTENLTLRESTIQGNAAVSGDISVLSHGGGIAQRVGNLTITNSVIADNLGDLGGGIHFDGNDLLIMRSVVAANAGLSGAGVYHAGGHAEIQASSIRDNSAGAFSLGGGIYNSGSLRVESTTISGNAAAYGGGLFSRTDSGEFEVTRIVNSTISGNTAFERGGGVRNALGRTVIEYSTITGNTAPPDEGGGVASRGYASARTQVHHSIIAGNSHSDVDFGTGSSNTFHSLGYNVIGTGNAVGKFQIVDQTGVTDPRLGPLADNGGPALPDGSRPLTHALLPGSPAINAGDLNARAQEGQVPLFDQRGEPFARVVNGRIDIGAFEYQEPSDLNLLVDTLTDESDGDHGRGDLSLREAIELANLWPSTDTIRFDAALTAAGPATILLTMGELKITDDLSIEGPGAELLTIDASGNDPTPNTNNGDGSRVFDINDMQENEVIEASIADLTLTGGDTRGSGGAVRTIENLTILRTTITANAASLIGRGGAVFSFSIGDAAVELSVEKK